LLRGSSPLTLGGTPPAESLIWKLNVFYGAASSSYHTSFFEFFLHHVNYSSIQKNTASMEIVRNIPPPVKNHGKSRGYISDTLQNLKSGKIKGRGIFLTNFIDYQ